MINIEAFLGQKFQLLSLPSTLLNLHEVASPSVSKGNNNDLNRLLGELIHSTFSAYLSGKRHTRLPSSNPVGRQELMQQVPRRLKWRVLSPRDPRTGTSFHEEGRGMSRAESREKSALRYGICKRKREKPIFNNQKYEK